MQVLSDHAFGRKTGRHVSRFKHRMVAMAVAIALFVCPTVAWGAGDGTGGGDGPALPLYISASSPYNGAVGVSVSTTRLWLQYTHNVADAQVASTNCSLISVWGPNGQVPASVWVVDTQTNFEQRQYLYITLYDQLQPGSTYVVQAAPGIAARNGLHVTGQTETISFTTEFIQSSQGAENESSAQDSQPSASENQFEETSDQAIVESSSVLSENSATEDEGSSSEEGFEEGSVQGNEDLVDNLTIREIALAEQSDGRVGSELGTSPLPSAGNAPGRAVAYSVSMAILLVAGGVCKHLLYRKDI